MRTRDNKMTTTRTLLLWLISISTAFHSYSQAASEWYIDDWFLEGSTTFSYPVLTVVPGDTISFEWNVTDHGVNDVWIYPSLDCDDNSGAVLVSYQSPAMYNVTTKDVGRTLFFVNSIGRRCQLGLSLYANVVVVATPAEKEVTTTNDTTSNNTLTYEATDDADDIDTEIEMDDSISLDGNDTLGVSTNETDDLISIDDIVNDPEVAIGIQSSSSEQGGKEDDEARDSDDSAAFQMQKWYCSLGATFAVLLTAVILT